MQQWLERRQKNNILTKILFYKEQFKESLYNRKFIEENMQAAITERQFMMYLQPKYSIAKMKLLEQRLWCAGVIQNVV